MQAAHASSLVFFWAATSLTLGSPSTWAQAGQQPVAAEASASAGAKLTTTQTDARSRRTPGIGKNAQKRMASRHQSDASTGKASLKLDTRTAARAAAANAPGKLATPATVGNANTATSATAAITPNMRQNLFGPASPTSIEMGDRPARSTSLCGSGRGRGLAELDIRTTAVLLPEINGLQPRTICARRGVLIADYAFR